MLPGFAFGFSQAFPQKTRSECVDVLPKCPATFGRECLMSPQTRTVRHTQCKAYANVQCTWAAEFGGLRLSSWMFLDFRSEKDTGIVQPNCCNQFLKPPWCSRTGRPSGSQHVFFMPVVQQNLPRLWLIAAKETKKISANCTRCLILSTMLILNT